MASRANIIIDQGTDFSTTITVTGDDGNALDLTGYSAASKMRKHYTSSNSTAFSCAVSTSEGTVTLSMNNSVTANIAAGRYLYDLEVTDSGGLVTRITEGIVTVTPGVTY